MKRLGFSLALLLALASPQLFGDEGGPRGGDDREAPQDSWQVLTYPDPAPGVAKTYCYGINGSGDLVGGYVAPSMPSHAFLQSDGQYFDLQPAIATSSTAWGINARGDIVGDYYVGSQEHGFLLRRGTLVTIDFAGKAMVHPRDINSRGDIAGSSMTSNVSTSPQQGFVLKKDGTLLDVLFPNATSTSVFGINDRADVAGEYRDAAGVIHGFLLTRKGEFIALDYPAAKTTSAQKVNARGDVIGYYWDSGSPSISHGFVWREGEFRQEDYPGAVHTMIHGLNNEGDTCGMMSFTPLGSPTTTWGGFVRLRHSDRDESDDR